MKYDEALTSAKALVPLVLSVLTTAGSMFRGVYEEQERVNQRPRRLKIRRKWKEGDSGGGFDDGYVYGGSSIGGARASDSKTMTVQSDIVDGTALDTRPMDKTNLFDFPDRMQKATDSWVALVEATFGADGVKLGQNIKRADDPYNRASDVAVRASVAPDINTSAPDSFLRSGDDAFSSAKSMETSPVPHLVLYNATTNVAFAVASVNFNSADRAEALSPAIRFVSMRTTGKQRRITTSPTMSMLPSVAKPLHVSHERIGMQLRYLTGTGFVDDDSSYAHLQFDAKYSAHLASRMALAAIK